MTDAPSDPRDPDRLVLAGIDEAGLGPLLGPLCVGAAAVSLPRWDVTEESVLPGFPDFWKLLADCVTSDHKSTDRRTIICDSKVLHTPKSIKPIEQSTLTLAAALDAETNGDAATLPPTFRGFLDRFSLTPMERFEDYPWYSGPALEAELPLEATADLCRMRGVSLQRSASTKGIRFEGIRSRPVLAGEFNDLLDIARNKADAHFAVIAGMLNKLWQRFPRLRVVVDRQGGRLFYRDSLRRHFPDARVKAFAEAKELPRKPGDSPAKSTRTKAKTKTKAKKSRDSDDDTPVYSAYRVTEGDRELDVTFVQDGEQASMLVAIASMFAKYTREHCMDALNAWWRVKVPDLRPTKGYVQDGRRFVDDICDAGLKDEIDNVRRILVRNK